MPTRFDLKINNRADVLPRLESIQTSIKIIDTRPFQSQNVSNSGCLKIDCLNGSSFIERKYFSSVGTHCLIPKSNGDLTRAVDDDDVAFGVIFVLFTFAMDQLLDVQNDSDHI